MPDSDTFSQHSEKTVNTVPIFSFNGSPAGDATGSPAVLRALLDLVDAAPDRAALDNVITVNAPALKVLSEHDAEQFAEAIQRRRAELQTGLHGDTDAALEFIAEYAALARLETITLVSIHPDIKGAPGANFRVDDAAGLRAWIDANQGKRNIYFVPNETTVHKKPACEEMVSARAAYGDIDPLEHEEKKLGGWRRERERIKNQFDGLSLLDEPEPSFLIDSGNGYQALYVFEEKIDLPDGAGRAEHVSEILKERFGGDPVGSTEHVFRLPGTINLPNKVKRDKRRIPRRARLVGGTRQRVRESEIPTLARTGTDKSNDAPAGDGGPSKGRKKIGDPSLMAKDMDMFGRAVDKMPNAFRYNDLGIIKVLAAMKAGCGGDEKFFAEHVVPFCTRWQGPSKGDETTFAEEKWRSIRDAEVGAAYVFRRARELTKDLPPDQRFTERDACEAPEYIERLNSEYAVVREGSDVAIGYFENEVIDAKQGLSRQKLERLTAADFDLLHANDCEPVVKGNSVTMVPISKLWKSHPARRTYKRVVFEPAPLALGGVNDMFEDQRPQSGSDTLNLFQGWPIEPKQGDWTLIREFIRDVISSGNQDHYEWLIRWIAYAIRYPDEPGHVAVVMRGLKGVGKSLFGSLIMRAIYGQYFFYITNPEHLIGRFNAHLADTLFMFADEAFFAGDKKGENVLNPVTSDNDHE